MRLIDADALIEFWKADFTEEERSKLRIPLDVAIENLRDAPTVDAVERKRGMWIFDIAYYDEDGCPCICLRCSECGEAYPESNFCPNCGAEMRGKANE